MPQITGIIMSYGLIIPIMWISFLNIPFAEQLRVERCKRRVLSLDLW